jgi:hypothetical protein
MTRTCDLRFRPTLQYAADQGILADNPAVGVKVRVKAATHEREKGFDEGEAKTILAAAPVPPSQKISVEMTASLLCSSAPSAARP